MLNTKSQIEPTVVPLNAPRILAMVIILKSTEPLSMWNNLAAPVAPSIAPPIKNTASLAPAVIAARPPCSPMIAAAFGEIFPIAFSNPSKINFFNDLSFESPFAESLPAFFVNFFVIVSKKSSI